ncbi:30S ribosomal protein S1 [Candidatus Finniella inopinata]|uniref:30S ribosomal protein S1 n=1 Tax=Candidatus Finniella inopinata TaxID=1696036 RepID=A0A4Q7DIM7_9PROT|nr:30S ribosomal protein S1 [Candidatus Finniella inopinata]RZI46069.1 30S ribosomal protein S1 [Candidatus Finniella inopinata]
MSNLTSQAPIEKESFLALLEGSFAGQKNFENTVVKGTIVAIRNDLAIVDVGLKSEGRVPLKEIQTKDQEEVRVGDKIDVYVERLEDKNGEVVLSIEKARREAAWDELEKAHAEGLLINGTIFGRVKGGFAVDLNGAIAFLPGSQVDIRPIRDISALMNILQPFKLLKMDKARSNIVVSRRSVLEESRAEARTELVSQLTEGQILDGIVKNITDYGAFVDLGGVDGLLHVTDISWKRINHPSDMLKIGESIKVQVIRFNKETQRISLGMKQLENDPWKGIEENYAIGSRHMGRITNIADYGAFVELENGIEGLIYVTEMSWTKKNVHPSKIVTVGQEVNVVILEVDTNKRRISLGLKQCSENPWQKFMEQHPAGSTLDGVVKNVTEFGLFVGVSEELDGMVHLSDLSWDKPGEEAMADFTKGQTITVKVLDVDFEKERISLGVKQLSVDTFAEASDKVQKGQVVTCTITQTTDKGLDVSVAEGLTGFIKKIDLSRDRAYQNPDRFSVGEKVDAKVLTVDRQSRKITLSIKAREIDEEKQALSEYGSSDSGASLGDILGAALKKKKGNDESAGA